MSDPDRRLRERFGALKRRDERLVPAFADVLGRARPSGRRLRRPGLIAAVAAAAVLLLVWRLGSGHEPVAMSYPTDFLLHLPGAELLRVVPELGAVPEVRFN